MHRAPFFSGNIVICDPWKSVDANNGISGPTSTDELLVTHQIDIADIDRKLDGRDDGFVMGYSDIRLVG